jgi:hypothetical protein
MGRAYHRAISPTRALLLFPLRPSAAAPALRPPGAAAALLPPAAAGAYLLARGCGAGDAAAAALGLLGIVLGIGLGGALATTVARRLAGRVGLHVHLVFAAWTVLLLLLALAAAAALGLGATAPLAAALAVLVWGVVAGTGVLGSELEPGRALVASCAGATGAIAGAVLVALLVFGNLVLAAPAPAGAHGVAAGTPLLVRREEAPAPGALVLTDARALARARPGDPPPIGRVFFFLGGAWGGRAVSD